MLYHLSTATDEVYGSSVVHHMIRLTFAILRRREYLKTSRHTFHVYVSLMIVLSETNFWRTERNPTEEKGQFCCVLECIYLVSRLNWWRAHKILTNCPLRFYACVHFLLCVIGSILKCLEHSISNEFLTQSDSYSMSRDCLSDWLIGAWCYRRCTCETRNKVLF